MWNVVEQVGRWIALAGAAAALCVLLALGVAVGARRGHWVPLKRLSVRLLEFLYLPVRLLLSVLPGAPSLDAMMVALRNRGNRARFARSRSRLLLAPACLRDPACPAPSGPRGIQCMRCGRCKVRELEAQATRLGYKVFVLAGSAAVPRLVAEERPDAALLVACPYECNKVMMALGRLATYAVPLDRNGCVGTDVALARVAEALRLGLPLEHRQGGV